MAESIQPAGAGAGKSSREQIEHYLHRHEEQGWQLVALLSHYNQARAWLKENLGQYPEAFTQEERENLEEIDLQLFYAGYFDEKRPYKADE